MRRVALVTLLWPALLGWFGCSGENSAMEVLDTVDGSVEDTLEDRLALEGDLLSDVPFVTGDKGGEDPGPVDVTSADVPEEVFFDVDDTHNPLDLDLQSGICGTPQAPTIPSVPVGTVLQFHVGNVDVEIETLVEAVDSAPATPSWTLSSKVTLDTPGLVRVSARSVVTDCEAEPFQHQYQVMETLPPPAGLPGSDAVSLDEEGIVGWAEDAPTVVKGEGLSEEFSDPKKALGPATGNSGDVLSLGRGGSVVLTFQGGISDGPGADFAVFENGFADSFLELARVEVSSNGSSFVAFDTLYLLTDPIGPFSYMDPGGFMGFAGRYRGGFGTPFDLSDLSPKPAVISGMVDLSAICCVKIMDVVGDGSEFDSFGNPVYDPYPTQDSAGFDLDGVAVLNEPSLN